MRAASYFRCFSLIPLLTLLVLGCSSELGGDAGGGNRLLGPAAAASSGFSYAVIGAGGGLVSDGTSSLEIPAGALSEPVQVTLETYVEGGKTLARISPSALEFARPATLAMAVPSGASSTSSYQILRFDDDSGTWNNIGGSVGGGIVSAPVPDGSRYQVDIIG